uniref:Calpain catalytic domain-containing protein n=1 Tax=Macrostomum lignano TaxID=282301 RepID=A0A1I8JP36_9PLAT
MLRHFKLQLSSWCCGVVQGNPVVLVSAAWFPLWKVWKVDGRSPGSPLVADELAEVLRPENVGEVRFGPEVLVGFCMRDLHGKWVGLMPDLVRELGKELHFQPNFTLVADGRYGAYDEKNDTWSGLIARSVPQPGGLCRRPLTITALREKHVDFSITFFLGVFDAGVWCASFFRGRQAEHSARDTSVSHALLAQMNDFSLFGSLYYTISTGCFQGYRRSPKSPGGSLPQRLLVVVRLRIRCLLHGRLPLRLGASRGGLERQFGIEDIPELNPSRHRCVQGRHTCDPVMQMFYRQYMAGLNKNSKLANVNTVEALLEAVMESTMADFYSRYSGCEVIAAATLISDNSYAFAFPVGSKKLRDVNKVLLTLRESRWP